MDIQGLPGIYNSDREAFIGFPMKIQAVLSLGYHPKLMGGNVHCLSMSDPWERVEQKVVIHVYPIC